MTLRMTAQEALFAMREDRRQSQAEKWKALAKVQIADAGLPRAVEEYQFAVALGRRWRFDFAWPDQRIALEIEGAVFGRTVTTITGEKVRVGGRHSTGAGLQADCEKYSWAAILGWMLVRATTTMVRDDKAMALLQAAFHARTAKGA